MAAIVLLLAGILVVLALTDWRLATAYLSFLVLALAVMTRLRGFAVPRIKETRQASREAAGHVSGSLGEMLGAV